MKHFHLLITGLALGALGLLAAATATILQALGNVIAWAVGGSPAAWALTNELVGLALAARPGPSPQARFAAPLTGRPEATAFA